jgi:hypothetical protein
MDKHIIPECFIDTNLVETLVPTKFGYNHQKCCSKVVKLMKEQTGLKDGFALGIVDEDKKILDYIKEFDLIRDKKQLKLLKHPLKQHYIIYISPAIEKWIIQNADEVNINLVDFNLPHDFLALRSITKVKTSSKDATFKKLFKALYEQNASGLVLLSQWITYLKQHPYDADLSFFENN